MAAARPLVSRATRNAVRRLMSTLYVAAIAEYWENENFARSETFTPREGGVRKQTYDAYEASVDWTDEGHARRALRVFESLLRRLDRDIRNFGADGLDPTELDELREALERDGYLLDGELRVRPAPVTGDPGRLAAVPDDARNITQVTRRRLFKHLAKRGVQWFGDLDEIDFLNRLYDLHLLPSTDMRFTDAEDDIRQHRYNNYDWEDDWIYLDERFGLCDGPDAVLLKFLSEMLHPEVRSDDAEAAAVAELVDEMVRRDGYAFTPVADISGYPIYGARPQTSHAGSLANEGAQASGPLLQAKHVGAPATPDQHGIEGGAGEDTLAGDLPVLSEGSYAAVQSAARGHRKDYALDRVRMEIGGQAEVFGATHKATGVRVAFKRRLSQRETPAARMRREIDVAQILNAHPNYVPILDANPAEGWLVMPMAQGTAAANREQLKDPGALRELVDALLSVLEAAHGGDWLHRDVKPSNILLLDGRWRLGDWGVVRRPRGQTTSDRTRAEVGTDGFAAPELFIDAHESTPAADIYGVGRVIAWALAEGHPVMQRRLLPAAGPWRDIVRATTAQDPNRRPQTAADLRQLMHEKLTGPVQSPAEQGEHLLAAALSGGTEAVDAFLTFTADHPDAPDLYVGTLTQLKPETAAEGLIRLPAEAELLIEALSAHAVDRQLRARQDEIHRAVLWLQRVSAFAASAGSWDLMDEAARAMCVWDGAWSPVRARDTVASWLLTLRGEAAVLMASALEDHPRCAIRYRSLLNEPALALQIRSAMRKGTH
ncbi:MULTISPECIES: serine/threonine protein kinase [unclassified Streptomyces]|uniref:AbiJ-related protein n=1 Tax=unclassified Streptomyces TaxID=2593676 RepID=UPI0022549631|nr:MULTISPECIES: serine/threonine protein kinase [unclassified Streptomyces]MCX4650220.1 serine/threonine protein kinase [Streptomyces sp. NBC_01446]MCX5327784.1 serine/threonine protein kinase [Streptomyces sp. NBC_00120]